MSSHHEFIEKLTSKLENWDYQLDRLEHRLEDLPEEIMAKVKIELEQLSQKKAEFKEEIHELESVSAEKFEELNQKMTDAWDGVKFAVNTPEFEITVDI